MKYEVKRVARWTLLNALLGILVYYGFVEGVNGARNASVFWIWFVSIVSLAFLIPDVAKPIREKGPPVPTFVDITFDCAIVGLLAWQGHFLLATIFLVHTCILHGVYASEHKS